MTGQHAERPTARGRIARHQDIGIPVSTEIPHGKGCGAGRHRVVVSWLKRSIADAQQDIHRPVGVCQNDVGPPIPIEIPSGQGRGGVRGHVIALPQILELTGSQADRYPSFPQNAHIVGISIVVKIRLARRGSPAKRTRRGLEECPVAPAQKRG